MTARHNISKELDLITQTHTVHTHTHTDCTYTYSHTLYTHILTHCTYTPSHTENLKLCTMTKRIHFSMSLSATSNTHIYLLLIHLYTGQEGRKEWWITLTGNMFLLLRRQQSRGPTSHQCHPAWPATSLPAATGLRPDYTPSPGLRHPHHHPHPAGAQAEVWAWLCMTTTQTINACTTEGMYGCWHVILPFRHGVLSTDIRKVQHTVTHSDTHWHTLTHTDTQTTIRWDGYMH